MILFRFPTGTIHLAGSPKGNYMDVWFLPHANGEDVLIITEWESGTVDSSWGSDDSVEFHRSGGLEDANTEPSERVVATAARRFPEADDWAA